MMSKATKVISKEEAKQQGLKYFFTGVPCGRGHISERRTKTGTCIQCDRDRVKAWQEKNPDRQKEFEKKYKSNNYERVLKNKRAWVERNPESNKNYREANKERVKELSKAKYERNREGYIQKSKEWVASNKERRLETYDAWYKSGGGAIARIHATKRKSHLRRATPDWLTEDHLDEIKAIYAEAVRLEHETGKKYHVDHIVPLQGERVSGLHVPWNLRVISAFENMAKKNRFPE
jgi:hypothetical protein